MAGVKIVDLPALGRDLISTDLLEVSLNGGGSRKITGQEIMNASKLAIGSTPIVSGTVGRLLFQGTGNVLSQPSSLFYDAVNNRLGIGTTTPGASLDVVYESTFQSRIDMYGTLYMYNNITSLSGNIWLSDGYAIGDWGTGNNRIEFYNNRMSFFGNGNEALRIVGSTGNLLVNTVTDAGFRLDVNGTARVNAQLEVNSTNSTQGILLKHFALATTATQIYYNSPDAVTYFDTLFNYNASSSFGSYNFRTKNSSNVLTSRLFIQGWDGSVGIGTTTPAATLDVNGTARVTTQLSVGSEISVGSLGIDGYVYLNRASTGGNVGGIRAQSSGSEIGGGGFIDRILCSNGSGLFFYTWTGSGSVSNQRMQIFGTSGNVLIQNGGTFTDAGYRLDVNGTARVQDTFSALNASSNGIRLTNGPSIEFWAAVSRITLQRAGNNALVIGGQSGFAMSTVNAGTMIGGVDQNSLLASAQLQVDSTTKGFLPPRMTNAQRAAIASPAVGLIVYCTDATEGLYVYKSTGWTFMV